MEKTEVNNAGNEVRFVSLGPGNAAYLTLQAVRTLNEADKIYCFATETGGVRRSYAADIVAQAGVSQDKVCMVTVPMSDDRTVVNGIYDTLAVRIADEWRAGVCVAVATEGDGGVFATTHYVLDRLLRLHVPVVQMPGVPSFIAAASMARLHLVKLSERLLVIPGNVGAEEIEKLVESGTNVVVMKLSKASRAVKECMSRHPEYAYHFFRNVGMPDESYSCDADELMNLDFPYFSLMIIQREKA